jgi:hypothetical protein
VGDPAAVILPDGQATPGTLTRIGTTATSSGGGSGSGSSSVTVPLYIVLKHPLEAGSIDQAPVQVQITTATARRALAVPATALLALRDGRFAVETVDAHRATRLVPVAVGLFDDALGLVQVSGSGLVPGRRLVVPASGEAPAPRAPFTDPSASRALTRQNRGRLEVAAVDRRGRGLPARLRRSQSQADEGHREHTKEATHA